ACATPSWVRRRVLARARAGAAISRKPFSFMSTSDPPATSPGKPHSWSATQSRICDIAITLGNTRIQQNQPKTAEIEPAGPVLQCSVQCLEGLITMAPHPDVGDRKSVV